jgi:hypothetical protein
MTDRLSLAAKDAEDLEILSACLQDAVGKLKDFAYLPRRHRFALLVNRFQWEDAAAGRRVRAGLYFDGVLAARARNLKRGAGDAVVSLLAVRFTPKPGEEPAGEIALVLSGGGAIALTVECIEAGLRDLSGPWSARGRPAHELPTQESGDR